MGSKIKNYKEKNSCLLTWGILCVIVCLISIFIHECGHGLANSLRGVQCSTGFNRVGDIYKFPKDINFRSEYGLERDSLFDLGVPVTLILAVLGTSIFTKSKNKNIKLVSLAVAGVNSLIRFIPCLFVILVPLFTGKNHEEDEFGTGIVLNEITGIHVATYVPALISIVVSVACMYFLYKNLKDKISKTIIIKCEIVIVLSYFITMIIANFLDNLIRINWQSIIWNIERLQKCNLSEI